MFNIINKIREKRLIPTNPGAFKGPIDERDFIFEEICGSVDIDWEHPFVVPFSLKVESQGSSSSCVGHAISKYLEVLEQIENKHFIDLSPRFIYSQICLPNGGAYIRDGIKLTVNSGCALESDVPSYPATEVLMRDSSAITDQIRSSAKTYKSKSYVTISHNNDIDIVAQVIKQGYGAVTGVYGDDAGWSGVNGFVCPPKSSITAWGHAIMLVGYGLIKKKKYIKFINSWGRWGYKKSGFGLLGEDYFASGNVFDLWTLIDQPNPITTNMLKIIGDKATSKQYALGIDGLLHWIVDINCLQNFSNAGMVNKDEVEWKDNLDSYTVDCPWAALIK